jgi:hypothetical protein
VTTKTAWFKLRLSDAELDEWRQAACQARTPVSVYVRQSLASSIKRDRALREQAEQEERQREMESRAREALRRQATPHRCICAAMAKGAYCRRCNAIR